jgi:hypothetical protein
LVTSGCAREQWRPADSERLSATIEHPLVPLSSVPVTIFEGTEKGSEVRVESRLLDRTERISGAAAAVVEVREYKDGALIERTYDYYAQDRQGNVLYLGEQVDDIEDGKVVGHGGQWLAGKDDARPGLFMPVEPRLGQTFQQERAPGIAEDRSTVVAVDVEVETPVRTFESCIKTKDFAPLDNATEFKYYCPGVGLVREEGAGGQLDLLRYR